MKVGFIGLGKLVRQVGVEFEKPIIVNGSFYVTDVYAQRDDSVIIVECGKCSNKKLNDFRTKYIAHHYKYGGDIPFAWGFVV